jgi:hypothetical protein
MMPITDHEVFHPPDDGATLWRFMDLPRYVDLLYRNALWLSRADQLSDPYEGYYTVADVTQSRTFWASFEGPTPTVMMSVDGIPTEELLAQMRDTVRRLCFVSCWNQTEYESAAMWSQYARESGVAIRTTVGRLRKAVQGDVRVMFIGSVAYADYNEVITPIDNALRPLVRKRLSFEHEQEVRLVWVHPYEHPPIGVHVTTDLSALIEAVHVAPASPIWFREAVAAVTERFKCLVSVTQSSLSQSPMA